VKFFTSQRLVRLQDRSNKGKFAAALEDWERAAHAYRQHLLRVRHELPGELQQLIDAIPLHDARVLDMWWGGRTHFTITLQPESDPLRLVVLTYSLMEPPAIQQDVLPESIRSEPIAWLYDELDLGTNAARRTQAFLHRILLSDGREVDLHFRKVTVKKPIPVVPASPLLATPSQVSAGSASPTSGRHSA